MKIIQSSVSIAYEKIENFRDKFVKSERILKDSFCASTLLSIPDNVQDEIPRAVAQSKNFHSNFTIALNVATLYTVYDDIYNKDWKMCFEYIKSKSNIVYNLVNELTDKKNNFSGLVITLEFDENNNRGLELIKNNLLSKNAKAFSNIINAACKFAYVYNDSYYVNILIENTNGIAKKGVADKLLVTLDINNKRKKENNIIDNNDFNEILNIADSFINNKLDGLIMKGDL